MKRVFVPTILLLLAMSSLQAQSQAAKDLAALVKASFVYSPKLEEARNAELLAADKLRLVELNARPDFNADMTYAYVMPKIEWPINGQKVQFAPVNSLNGFVSGSYVLADFGRQKAALDRARNEQLSQQHTREVAELGIAYQVAQLYYQLLYTRKSIAIQDTLIHVLKESLRVAENQFQNGTALEIDVLSIRSTILNEESRKTEFVSLLHKQEIMMQYATGKSVSEGGEMHWVSPLVSATSDTINPTIQLQIDKLQQSKLEVAAAQLKTRPLVSLRGVMGTRNGYLPLVNDLRFNYQAGVGLSVPLYTGGKIQQQIQIQKRLAMQQQLALTTMKKDLERDLNMAEEELRASREKEARLPPQVLLAEKVVEVARSKYRNGTGLYLEVITAGSALQKAYLNQLQAQYQVCLAQLEIARLKGTKFW